VRGGERAAAPIGSAGWSWTHQLRTGRQAHEAPGGDGSLGRKPIYQGLRRPVRSTAHITQQVANGLLACGSKIAVEHRRSAPGPTREW
jgi:hypothetical protein